MLGKLLCAIGLHKYREGRKWHRAQGTVMVCVRPGCIAAKLKKW